MTELEEAISNYENDRIIQPENFKASYEAARKYAALKPTLDELVEARGKCSGGTWWADGTGINVQPVGGNSYGLSMRTLANGLFVVTAANSINKIKEVMKDE